MWFTSYSRRRSAASTRSGSSPSFRRRTARPSDRRRPRREPLVHHPLSGRIGRMTTSGALDGICLPDPSSQPGEITRGPTGISGSPRRGEASRSDHDGGRRHGVSRVGQRCRHYAGPDGNIWFTEAEHQPDRANHPRGNRDEVRLPGVAESSALRRNRAGPGRQPLVRARPTLDSARTASARITPGGRRVGLLIGTTSPATASPGTGRARLAGRSQGALGDG